MESNLYCIGCGVKLQSENEQAKGYIPSSAIGRENALCRRCFQLRHYNKNEEVSLEDEDFLHMVSEINKTDSLVIHVVDLFDIEGTLLQSLHRIVGNQSIILMANKIDLLPKSTNSTKLIHWIRKKSKEAGLKIEEVLLISASTGLGIEEAAMTMEEKREGKDIYVVGVTNVGKSTFINQLIERSLGEKESITTSYFPGTTLGFISIPLDENTALIDTPGIVNQQQIAHYVSQEDLKIITPKKEVKSRIYQLNNKQTLFIGGLVRMDFVKGERQSFVCFFSNGLPIHRTKLEKAEELFANQQGGLLAPPNQTSQALLPAFTKQSYRITEPYTDIVIAGLGWITVLNGEATIDIHCPKGVSVHLRPSVHRK